MIPSRILALSCVLLLCGCQTLSSSADVETVKAAQERYEAIKDEPSIQAAAPEELALAKLYLDKATQVFRRGWVNRDIDQFAILSLAYSDLAYEKGTLATVLQSTEQVAQTREMLNNLGLAITDRGLLLYLDNDSFVGDTANLADDIDQTLDFLAEFLVSSPERKVLIESYSDNAASPAQNRRFATARGETVKAELLRRGVNSRRIKISALGEAFPVASNANPLGRLLNRRVELRVGSVNGKFPPSIEAQ